MTRVDLLYELKCTVTEIVELQERLALSDNFREVRQMEKRLKELRCLKMWALQQLDRMHGEATA